MTTSSKAIDRLFGRDLWFDVTQGEGADLIITPAKDWQFVVGREAMRQSLIRRLITNPGEWTTLPDFGVGARLFLKARNTRSNRDLLCERIRAQFLRDDRVASVDKIAVEMTPTSLALAIDVTPIGRLATGAALRVQTVVR